MDATSEGEFMEEDAYASFMASKPFTFLVGPEKKAFAIHSALVAGQSKVLEKLVLGDMQEAREGSVVWEHVDEQTFIRFSQYAYMGIYRYPSFRPRAPRVADFGDAWGNDRPEDRTGMIESRRHRTRKVKKKVRPQIVHSWHTGLIEPESESESESERTNKGKELWTAFEKKLSSTEPYMAMKQASPLGDGEESNAELLLCHARLYVFAECYDIRKLMHLSLCTLHHVLVKVPESDEMTSMAVKLLQYCYANDTPDALRDLAVEYTACRVEHLSKREEFQELVKVHGDFSVALVNALLSRID
ncbi:hypothetical protein E4U42_001162 [Claviceps africana]|uniref:BTB domain-containing protein n=1 Tax=Claviceps africana TaxID=83212 RepID=A0A8K0JA21_9HYPO|nr:hypothetical protein E4U42_001162 [Claviceps africana]